MWKEFGEQIITESKHLVMQKSPIRMIETFLEDYQRNPDSDFTKRFLVIKGPSGTGKYTAASFLAKKHNYDIVSELEIFNEIVRENEETRERMIEKGIMTEDQEIQYPTNFQVFKRAIEMSRSFNSLVKKTVIILRNLPEIMRAYVRSGMNVVWQKTSSMVNGSAKITPTSPIIICLNLEIADTFSIVNSFNGPDFTKRYVEQVPVSHCKIIKLRYVAKKANELLLDGQRFLSEDQRNELIDKCNGDVRSLLNMINFERIKVKYQRGGRSRSKRMLKNENGEVEGGYRDQSKSVFQRLGRLLYVKEEEGQVSLKQLAREQTNCHFGHSYFRE